MKQDFKAIWKNLAANKQNSAIHSIQYCILKAMASKTDDKVAVAKHFLRKAFTAVTNPNKLANGREPFQALSTWENNAAITFKHWNGREYEVRFARLLGVQAMDILTEEEVAEYNRIYEAINPARLVRRYSYFFSRQDYFEEYQLVQTAHVALELGHALDADQIKDLHFTCCGVADVDALEDVERLLQSMKLPYRVFREPDIGNQKTAIGVFPVEEHKRGLLRNYKLLRFKRPVVETVDELEVVI